MSHSTLFGAIAVPASAQDPFACSDPQALQFCGSSRSGSFQAACSRLLDSFPGHDSLRFLSAERAMLDAEEPDGQTMFTLIDHTGIARTLEELEALLQSMPKAAEVLAEQVLPYPEDLTPAQVAEALASATPCRELNQEVPEGEDGDTAQFLFAALVSLCRLLRTARDNSESVVA